jgi:hypothetical protein
MSESKQVAVAEQPQQLITMDSVESSQIAAIGYDEATQTLAIQFKGGTRATYHYANVPSEEFAAFRDAESVGSYFYRNIKPFPDKYPYTRIEAKTEQA